MKLAPPIPTPRNSAGAAEEVVTVPAVVADDDDAEHGVVEQCRSNPQMVNLAEVAGVIPRLRAVRV